MNISVICHVKSRKFFIPFVAILSISFWFLSSPHDFLPHFENYTVGTVFSLTYPDVGNENRRKLRDPSVARIMYL